MSHLSLSGMARTACVAAAMLLCAAAPSQAQVSADNEDGVWKTDPSVHRDGGRGAFVPGQVIVKFRDNTTVRVSRPNGRFQSVSATGVDQLLRRYGASDMARLFPAARHKATSSLRVAKAPDGSTIREHNLDQVYCVKLQSLRPDSTLALAKELTALPEVEYAEPNYIAFLTAMRPSEGTGAAPVERADGAGASSSSLFDGSWESNPLANQQYGLTYEGLPQLWRKPVVNSKRPVVAIIDTGVDITHPDLKDNIWTNEAEADGEPDYDNDGNGFAGDIHGWDFVNNSPDIRDYNSHGTHCAGIAAAAQNGIGIIGANPKALIMPVTVMQSDGTGDYATIAKGIQYAADNGATVLNMSFGGYANSRVLRQALENAYHSCVLVAAAGNDGLAIYPECNPLFYGTMFPAAYSFVLGVQATDATGQLTKWSNYDCDGPNYSAETSPADPEGYNYELSAPGLGIISTVLGGSYKEMSGTSMAAPLMAGGISALMMVKQYDSQEILWGDLIHSSNLLAAYNIQDRPAEIDFLGMQMGDRKELTDGEIDENSYASNDGEADAGETITIYPILRTTFGEAKNIKLRLEMGDAYEDASLVDITTPEADFGMSLSAYGKGVSKNPLVMKLSPDIADARHLKMKVVATADGTSTTFEQPFTLTVSNMHKIGGIIDKDTTLTADKTWYVTENIGIPKGVTLTIEPGTRLEFATGMGISSSGKLVAKGTPEKHIVFTKHTGEGQWAGVRTHDNEDNILQPGIYSNADTTLFTLSKTEATPVFYRSSSGSLFRKEWFYNYASQTNKYKSFDLGSYLPTRYFPSGDERLTDPNYLTPIIQRMKDDFDAYNKELEEEGYSTVRSDYYNRSFDVMNGSLGWYISLNPRDAISYCELSYCDFSDYTKPYMYDCEVSEVIRGYSTNFDGERCNYVNNGIPINSQAYFMNSHSHNAFNYVNNTVGWNYGSLSYAEGSLPNYSQLVNSNWINCVGRTLQEGKYYGHTYWIKNNSETPSVDHADQPSYLGTAREDLVRPYCYEIGNAPNTFGKIDLSNMLKEPVHEAHGIVWKVVVDGKDAQDEYEDLAPLGVGRHSFCVWFNRPMNVNVAPQVSFGVRDPYTQVAVAEDGSWSADSTKYTVYVTITGKTSSDGVNQIYVRGAQDNEFFECPYEKTRFRVQVQAAGSMATGFMAEAGVGKVTLTWNNEHNDFADAMGFNVYRIDESDESACDTVRLNTQMVPVDSTSYTDYDVTPGKTYRYFYKVLSTDLREYDVSNVVAATVLTASLGDANGSGEVDVVDVVTTVNYSIGDRPKPFLFDAADVNADKQIDVLDVVGIIGMILGQDGSSTASASAVATYSVENGTVWVDCPVALAGVQVQLTMDERTEPTVASDLDGFEHASSWLTDNDYVFLAYSMGGLTLPAGRHALLHIGDAALSRLVLSDAQGHSVSLVDGSATGIDALTTTRMRTQKGIFSLDGRKIAGDASRFGSLPAGVYIVNGQKMVK